MNKKGKNKKGKTLNPLPSQEKSGDKNEEIELIGDKELEKTSELIDNVEIKTESVKEERVPDIVSEIITPPVDTKDEETPKKPKRNRGKKKKGKEDDFDDNDEGANGSFTQQSGEEIKADVLETEMELSDIPAMTPTARKKKNKKQNLEQKSEELMSSGQEKDLTACQKIVIEPETPKMKSETPATPELAEQEVKSKKKNKKKKRNDSERSDKEEISCTAAFQKLIGIEDKPLEVKLEGNIQDRAETTKPGTIHDTNPVPVESIQLQLEPEIQSPKDASVQESDVKKDSVITSLEEKDMTAVDSKSKKKNKKDKKHIPKSQEDDSIPKLDKPITEPPCLPVQKKELPEYIIKEDPKDITSTDKSDSSIVETSSKAKAKIAKPVEKKRKGKLENQSSESVPENIAVPSKTEEQVSLIMLESPEVQIAEKNIADIEHTVKPQELSTETVDTTTVSTEQMKELTMHDFESLNIIPNKAVGKKRKKVSTLPKTPDVSFEIFEPTLESDIKKLDSETIDVEKETPIVSESVPVKEPEITVMSETSAVPVNVDTSVNITSIDKPLIQTEIKSHVLLTPEELCESKFVLVENLVTERTEDAQKCETKSAKKRKKSPKPPKNDEPKVQIESQALKPEYVEECLPKSDITKEMSDKIDTSNITKIYDIEINSIKADESEGSVCDAVPDITYPRASSQQLSDSNNDNNMVIREIFPVQEVKAAIPKVDRTATEKEHNVSPNKEEKTDIKSKMMEVNQDMEELRLSIERSLAELTALEKSEDVLEKTFEPSKIKAKGNISTVRVEDFIQKKDEHEKIIQISDAEKFSIEQPLDVSKSTDIMQDNIKRTKKGQSTKDNIQHEDLKISEPETDIIGKPKDRKDVNKNVSMDITPVVDIKTDPLIPIPVEEKQINPTVTTKIEISKKEPMSEKEKNVEISATIASLILSEGIKPKQVEAEKIDTETKEKEESAQQETPPVCPARKDAKNKHKKKKGKQDSQVTSQQTQSTPSTTTSTSQSISSKEAKKEDKSDNKTDKKNDSEESKVKGKQQASELVTERDLFSEIDYEPIENFEDALMSSVDDVNKTFEMIVEQSQEQSNPKINIIAPDEERTPVSPSKNLLGHPDIPVQSNRRDYKKEKDKIPNEIAATVKIKDATYVEKKQSKNTQTINKLKDLRDCRMSDNEEFVYKYSFRKVFLQSSCHVCNKDLAGSRVPCCYCNLVFYCGIKHKDEDWPQHQALCFAVSTIGHLKDQKHIYADAKNITGHDFRLVRMQMIVSCEKVLKRRLVPWEQEALLYPRICAHVACREWRQMKLNDCQGCRQISYCMDNPDHCPKSHARWCKSYSLYQKLVSYQQTKGRLEPRLPTKVMKEQYTIPEKINEVLADMYEEKIDMNDIQYAALTQLATAPLTAAYCHQLCRNKNITPNGYKKSAFTIHVVGAELQFEADALNKWEVFFLHLRPDLQELRVVLVNYNLNPSNLPLELLGKIKLCEDCRQKKRRVVFCFQDKRTYADYKSSEDFVVPDIVCAFNPSIQRSSVYNGKDPWPSTVNIILKQRIPFIITAYTITELHKDCIRVKECSETGYNFISEPKYNNFASVRPDRNFISDDEMPLLFKNYCFAIICG